jgi:hypothetical protein
VIVPSVFYTTQTVLTTSLIVWKIYNQLQRTRNAGSVITFHTPNLVAIMRIMVESALVYTIGMIVQVGLTASDHPARIMANSLLTPLTGMLPLGMLLRTGMDIRADVSAV